MAAVADLKRRFGVGWGGIALYLALFVAGAAVVTTLGDLPDAPGRRSPPQVLVPGVAYGLGLAGVALAASNLPTYARLALTGAAGTGAAAETDGRVVVRGTVASTAGPLATPFEESEAVAYTTWVLTNAHDDAETAQSSEGNWTAVHVGEAATPFTVDDGSGPVRVDPGSARLSLRGREEQFVRAGEEPPAAVREFLVGSDVAVDIETDHARFEATTLEPGEETFVAGTVDGGTVRASLVAEGDHAGRVRDRVVRGGAVGTAVAAAGYLGLLLVAGVL